ncbi:dihydrolipoyllysine-residue succinyltransferase component of 2-oxoglutarate dehydrogenase complex, mitochondrial-like [Lineus longissimus]|uniref:dihydrolipoyllysine-residue succinyltransferase component of 2-oxoglutarate dehydrogenase complex, mitochondrial-like n=1 Tax=Lineus longissimus TaxID=88925 RepID=UPI00315CCC81
MAALLASSRTVPRFLSQISHKKSNLKCLQKTITSGVFKRSLLPIASNCPNIINGDCSSLALFSFHLDQRRHFHSTFKLWADDTITVKTPPFAESVTEGDINWLKEVGEAVEEDEVVAEIETDKTVVPVPSPTKGVIAELLAENGGRVEAGQEIFKLSTSGDAPAKKPEAAKPAEAASPPPPTAAAAPPPPPSATAGPIPTTPPPPPPVPSAPMSSIPVSAVKPTPVIAASAPASLAGSRTESRVKMNRMRLRIAQRLKEAQNTCAMLTTFNEIDMSNIMELRTKYKDAFLKKHNIKLGFMSAFIKASSYALMDQPAVNAVIDDKEIVYRDYVDISVAVATPKGLVVPVMRDVGDMNYAAIEKSLNALGEKAKDGALAVEDMDGGTFTISNGGVFGSMFGTPIINPPQSAILGMHGIFERPVAIKGKVEIRPMMYVALTYDHRLIDGREAVTFLRKIKTSVEDPRSMFLDL